MIYDDIIDIFKKNLYNSPLNIFDSVIPYQNINVYSYVIKQHNKIQHDISRDFKEN